MEPEAGNASPKEIIRSANSMEKAFVMFVNATNRIVSVYWVDFRGLPKIYIKLVPNALVEINTFRSHAWTFRDGQTGERLQVQRENVFWAQPYFTRNPRNQSEIVPARRRLQIHLPVKSFREYLLWYVVRKLKPSSRVVCEYELPKTLKDDLMSVLDEVKRFTDLEYN